MIAITLFNRGELAHGKRATRSRDELAEWFAHPVVTPDKSSAGGFSFATFRNDHRRKDNVEAVHAIALDIDKTQITPRAGADIFRACAGWIYTTATHTPAAPRWRAVLLVSAPLSANDYELVWRHLARNVAAANHVDVDEAAKDASRFWYAPTVAPERGDEHECHELAGELLDVPRLLEVARRCSSPAPTRSAPRLTNHGDAYLRAALNRAARAVADAADGERNATLNRETYALARLELDPTAIAETMREAARAAGLGRAETEKTIASALRARARGAA